MNDMLALADKEGIDVFIHALTPPLYGIYIERESFPPLIGLSRAIEHNVPFVRSVMAEELGHHYTSAGVSLYQHYGSNYNYCDRCLVDKSEAKALRWAALYLVPDDALSEAIKNGIEYPAALAAHFKVMPYLMDFRLKLFEQSPASTNLRREW